MSSEADLQTTINALIAPGKGILAADESGPTIAKRFESVGIALTEENRRAYRDLLLSTPGVGQYLGGVILFDETMGQASADGTPLPVLAAKQGIVPGIKVDAGKIALEGSPGDDITEGMDGLGKRLAAYREQGARFAKWRAVYNISDVLPSRLAIEANADGLARYAAICQDQRIVPIVEPEVLMDGSHTQARCAEVTEAVLAEVFAALRRHHVVLEHMLLKPSMIVAGKDSPKASVDDVATATIRVLKRTVPAAVPGIFFLSGGQSPAEATAHLDAMNRKGGLPWVLSYSYGRALQDTVLQAWKGQSVNVPAAQAALLLRAKLNSAAREGRYEASQEKG